MLLPDLEEHYVEARGGEGDERQRRPPQHESPEAEAPVAENLAFVTPDHRETEEALRESGLEWTALRNGLYTEY